MLGLDRFKSMLQYAAKCVKAEERRFSELDAAAGGDGDHGTAMVTAFDAMLTVDGSDFKTYVTNLSVALQEAACGSTSSLYGAWLEGMAAALPESCTVLDGPLTAAMFEGGLSELKFVTRARQGGKTLMDALIPATDTMVSVVLEGVESMLRKAAAAALEGAEATDMMQAKFGRSRNLGERSVGHRDAGAASMACIFNAFATEYKRMM